MSVELPSVSVPELSHYSEQVEVVQHHDLQGLVELNNLAAHIFAHDDQFAEARDLLGTGSKERRWLLRAVETNDFPPEENVGTEIFRELYRVTHVREELSRQLTLRYLDEEATFGLEPYEIEVLRTSCEIGKYYDELGLLWRDEVRYNPLNEHAKELGLVNPYTVIRLEDGQDLRQVPYVEAFPEQIDAVTTAFRQMSAQVEGEGDEAKALADYYVAYADALDSTELLELEAMWMLVDEKWMESRSRLQSWSHREYQYIDPNAIRVAPDYRLTVQIGEVSEGIKATQEALKKYIWRRFGRFQVIKDTFIGLDQVIIFDNAIDLVFAGGLGFRSPAKFLPNDDEVKKRVGTKILLNPESIRERERYGKELAKQVFTHEDDQRFFDMVDPIVDVLERWLGGHELAEPLCAKASVEEALGKDLVARLNEDLTYLFTTVAMMDWKDDGGLTENDLLRYTISSLQAYLRYIEIGRGSEDLYSYYEGIGLLGFARMIQVGFIYQDDGGNWRINPGSGVVREVLELHVADLDEQVDFTDKLDKGCGEAYIARAQETEKTELVRDLILRVDPEATFD